MKSFLLLSHLETINVPIFCLWKKFVLILLKITNFGDLI